VSDAPDALDEVVHQRTRLGILAVLAEADRAQFAFLKETLDLTDGNLSRHLMILEDAGLVRIDKGYEGKRPRTWASVTPAGKRAFRAEIAALRRLVARFDSANDAALEIPPESREPESRELVVRADRADRAARTSKRPTAS
jgi:DNA-binding MarR family transcriptional regulator